MHRLYFITFLFILQLTLWGQENKIKFTPLESGINTTDSEELGRWTIDGKSILFTRLSKDHLEVLTAHLDSLGHLINVEKMPAGTNYRGGGHAMSPDGKSIIFTICGDRMGLGSCDLYLSEFMDGVWT
ncbi:MAG: hypothetical protein ABIQ02_13270, partial [Saprospiraceae bacterium]